MHAKMSSKDKNENVLNVSSNIHKTSVGNAKYHEISTINKTDTSMYLYRIDKGISV